MYTDRPSGLMTGWFAAPSAVPKPHALATPFEVPSTVRHPAAPGSCVSAPVLGSIEKTATPPLIRPLVSSVAYSAWPSGEIVTPYGPSSPRPAAQVGLLVLSWPVSVVQPAGPGSCVSVPSELTWKIAMPLSL